MVESTVCRVCGGSSWRAFKQSTLSEPISSDDFRITDARYGHTGRVDRCELCGFKQVTDIGSVLEFYESLEDAAYDEGREQRALQARKLLEAVRKHKDGGSLLDIGAASGILLEQAVRLGFNTEGVEPSASLATRARAAGLNVHRGVFPHEAIKGRYDVITLVDVIEHVQDPVGLLREVASHLKDDGTGLLTTPDVQSLAARLLGPRWWHFRVAHISYFELATIKRALAVAGLEIVEVSRPPWYFTCEYAFERAMGYLPPSLRFGVPSLIGRATIRVNFRDSMQVIFKRSL